MTQNEDAIEVAKVLGNKLKPVYMFVAGVFAVVGVGAERIWNLSQFIHRDAAHEKQQDENLLALNARIDKCQVRLDSSHELDLKLIELIGNDLALIRAIQVELLPRNRRAQVRKDFEHQRMNGVRLMLEASLGKTD